MRVLLYTLGCKLNQCESEAIADAFSKEGFSVVSSQQEADLCIVNTCTVTGKAEQKARRMIRKYANEPQQPVVLVTGCYAQMEREAIEKLSPRVVVVSLDDKPSLLHLPTVLANAIVANIDLLDAVKRFVDEVPTESSKQSASPFDYDAATFSFHSRAFLKIQDGCDNSCAYCRVTIARGAAISLPLDEVVRRAQALEQEGFSEIVLTGVNISAYRDNDADLAVLLTTLLQNLSGEIRIRLSSLEPDKLDSSLVSVFTDPRIQPHFHIPVQSASNLVLERVDRHYEVSRLEEAIAMIRQVKDDPFIAADIITGLPGETDEEFEKSVQFLKAMDISQFHVFPFSPRPQTALYNAKDRVTESVRDERAKRLRELSTIHLRRYIDRQIGKELELILEECKNGVWSGLTGNYVKVSVQDVPSSAQRGDRITVRLKRQEKSLLPIGIYIAH